EVKTQASEQADSKLAQAYKLAAAVDHDAPGRIEIEHKPTSISDKQPLTPATRARRARTPPPALVPFRARSDAPYAPSNIERERKPYSSIPVESATDDTDPTPVPASKPIERERKPYSPAAAIENEHGIPTPTRDLQSDKHPFGPGAALSPDQTAALKVELFSGGPRKKESRYQRKPNRGVPEEKREEEMSLPFIGYTYKRFDAYRGEPTPASASPEKEDPLKDIKGVDVSDATIDSDIRASLDTDTKDDVPPSSSDTMIKEPSASNDREGVPPEQDRNSTSLSDFPRQTMYSKDANGMLVSQGGGVMGRSNSVSGPRPAAIIYNNQMDDHSPLHTPRSRRTSGYDDDIWEDRAHSPRRPRNRSQDQSRHRSRDPFHDRRQQLMKKLEELERKEEEEAARDRAQQEMIIADAKKTSSLDADLRSPKITENPFEDLSTIHHAQLPEPKPRYASSFGTRRHRKAESRWSHITDPDTRAALEEEDRSRAASLKYKQETEVVNESAHGLDNVMHLYGSYVEQSIPTAEPDAGTYMLEESVLQYMGSPSRTPAPRESSIPQSVSPRDAGMTSDEDEDEDVEGEEEGVDEEEAERV
ncbi:MAG: hypothetical protein Q9174_007079, partial [Haloplaca sp. 1 TL-2023]